MLLLHKERGEKARGDRRGGSGIVDDDDDNDNDNAAVLVTPTKRKRAEAQSSVDAFKTPTRTPTSNASMSKIRLTTPSKKNGSHVKAAQLQQQRNSFSDAIRGVGRRGERTVTVEPPDWTMPAIRRMCAALEIPKAAPHVYTGVRSVMAFEAARRDENGSGGGDENQRNDINKKRTADNRTGKLKGVRRKRIMSGDDGHLDTMEDNINGIKGNGDIHKFDNAEVGDDIAISAQASPSPSPIAMTNESGDPSNSGIIENNMMALMASLLLYTVARMRGVDTSPEDFIRQRDTAISALLLSSGGGGGGVATATGSVNLDATATNDADDDAGAGAGAGTVTVADDHSVKSNDIKSDRRSTILLSQIERTMRAAQNGWLLLEWYQNIREGSYDTEWDEDPNDDDDDEGEEEEEDDDDDYSGHGNRTVYSKQNPRNPYYTPQKSRARNDDAGPGLINGLTPRRLLKINAQQQQQQPGLCCTMMQYQVDYLSEGRRADFVCWKAGIMARVEEMERGGKGDPADGKDVM